ncbi:tigger transposable element-derived protein 1-like [Arapaima gigas]
MLRYFQAGKRERKVGEENHEEVGSAKLRKLSEASSDTEHPGTPEPSTSGLENISVSVVVYKSESESEFTPVTPLLLLLATHFVCPEDRCPPAAWKPGRTPRTGERRVEPRRKILD